MPQSPLPAPPKRPNWLASGISFYGDTRSIETFGCYLGIYKGYEPKLKILLDIDFPSAQPSIGGWSLIHKACVLAGGVNLHGESIPQETSWAAYHFRHTTKACHAANVVAALIVELYKANQMLLGRDPLSDCAIRAYQLAKVVRSFPLPSIEAEINALRKIC